MIHRQATAHQPKSVAVVGGGIAGLSTAWYLEKEAKKRESPLQITVLESTDRWGGKILTEQIEGPNGQPFIVEGGPDSFLTQKPWAVQLARELGLENQLLGTNDDRRKVFVLNNGRPAPLPDGVLLIVPTKIWPFARSPLLSPLGKLRMGLDLLIPAKRDGQDETLAEFISRRLGDEALDKIAEPLMSGIYNAEAERQSLLATFPRFRELEEKHGSLIRGMLASRRARRNGAAPSNPARPPLSMFVSLQQGTEDLIRALSLKLKCDLRLGSPVEGIRSLGDGYGIELGDGASLEVDAVVLAVPAFVAARLVRPMAPKAADGLDAIRYVSTGTISLAYRQEDVDLLPGFGLVIPRSEKRAINAITQTSIKFDRRAPAAHAMIRVFFGGSRTPGMMALDDGRLLDIVRQELKALLGINAPPLFHRIYRWPQANPQYDVGHLDRVEAIERDLPPGLFVTGSPYRGIGMPDCVHQGQQTAGQVFSRLAVDGALTLPGYNRVGVREQ